MRLGLAGGILAVIVIVAVILGYSAMFTVYQTQQALVVRLGQPIGAPITEPGLHFKMPLIDSVITIDKRILDLESSSGPSAPGAARHAEVITADQKQLVVDAFARYRIRDALQFYQTLGSIGVANAQLQILLNSALRRVLGEVTLIHVVRDERVALMARVREQIDREAQAYETGMKHGDTRMLLRPDSEFFRYFVDPSGKGRDGSFPGGAVRPPAPPR